jgi:hypothetical protein
MRDNRKQNISVRMSNADLKKIKEIARRLEVRESDVFRFAIRSSLAKLTPLHDNEMVGSDLVPVFVECGMELANYFDLDTDRLDTIINQGVSSPAKKVSKDDLELLALSALQEHYLYIRMKELFKTNKEGLPPATLLREYLMDKYVQGRLYENDTEKNETAEAQLAS